MAGTYRLTIDQGTTVDRALRWLKQGIPVDLTGFTARMEIRDRPGGVLLYRLSTADGTLSVGGADNLGAIGIHIPADVTSAWEWRSGVYDLELVSPAGVVTRLLQGSVTVSPEVTTGV
ncbi:hypothetical protein [Streptosporangium sp. OZ121]|uniref:hypothetical protein n=1 Tax=Streptosporangium sp. OZ121 TaxID=3444183 RepID=UPI003F7A3D53